MRPLLKVLDSLNALVVIAGIAACLIFLTSYSRQQDPAAISSAEASGSLMDFRVYYVSGMIATSSDRAQVYKQDVQDRYFKKYAAFSPEQSASYLPYAPHFLLLSIPLSQLSLNAAFLCWTAVGWITAIAGLISVRQSIAAQRGLGLELVAASLATLPSARCLVLGQISYLYVAFLSLYFRGILLKNDWLTAAMLTMTAIKPQVFVFFLVPLIALNKWKAIFLTAAMGLCAAIVAAAITSPETVLSYPSAMLSVVKQGHHAENPGQMVGLRGTFSDFLPPSVEGAATWIAAALGMLGVFFVWKKFPFNEKNSAWIIATTILIYLITGPHVHLYDCFFLSIAALCTMNSGGLINTVNSRGALRIWYSVLLVYPLFGWALFFIFGDDSPVLFRAHTATNIMLLICALARLRTGSQGGSARDAEDNPKDT